MKSSLCKYAFALVVVVALTGISQAAVILNSSGDLRFTDPKNAQGKHFHLHNVFLEAGKRYVFEMNSQHFDTYLQLRNPGGIVVAFNDDSGPALNARITFTAPTSGQYKLVATSFNAGATGSYSVRATRLQTVLLNVQGDLNFNDPRVNGRHLKVYNVQLQAGRQYTINLHSVHFDTLLKLTKNGQLVAQNDDGGPMQDSRIVFTPGSSGQYQIVATSFAQNATGHFTLTVRE